MLNVTSQVLAFLQDHPHDIWDAWSLSTRREFMGINKKQISDSLANMFARNAYPALIRVARGKYQWVPRQGEPTAAIPMTAP